MKKINIKDADYIYDDEDWEPKKQSRTKPKYNVVKFYMDYVGDGSQIYDCNYKDVWMLFNEGNAEWKKVDCKPNPNIGKPICFGGKYGLIACNREYFYSFNEDDINELNVLGGTKKRNKMLKLKKGLKQFIIDQVKKLDNSGEVLISSLYPNYPYCTRGGYYMKEVKFGMIFSQLDAPEYFDRYPYNSFDWCPNVCIY